MTTLRYLVPVSALILMAALVGCTSTKRNKSSDDLRILGDPESPEESAATTVERLMELANSPNSMLKEDQQGPGEDDGPDFASATPLPADRWIPGENDSRTIFPGDVFRANEGPILRKTLSIADTLPQAAREEWLNEIGKVKTKRVPLTLSNTELEQLRLANELLALPSRSVALDFRTNQRSPRNSVLEKHLSAFGGGTPPGKLNDIALLDKVSDQIEDTRQRLKNGEKLYIITSVTESETVKATYPGAPVGNRDAELIKNAFEALYPHLDQLEAEKTGEQITISRPPRVYWEFEARELTLEGDRLRIVPEGLARN